jgi:phage protein, HK97 gp10 family
MADEINVLGLKEIQSTLDKLPARLGEKVVRAALRAAAQPMRKDAQARAPVLKKPQWNRKAGTVKKSITIKRSKKDKYGVYLTVAGLSAKKVKEFTGGTRRKSTNNPDDPWYWVFLEFGTANQPAQEFMRPAFESQKFAAIRRFEEFAKRRVVREAEKLAREQGSKAA